MLHELDYDDSEAPSIGLVPPGVTWDDIYDHIKIAHHPLLVALDGGADHAGAYWDGTKMIVERTWAPTWMKPSPNSASSSGNVASTSPAERPARHEGRVGAC